MTRAFTILLAALTAFGCGSDIDVVSGSVSYPQREALPPDAEVHVALAEASTGDSAAAIIAEQVIAAPDQMPIQFRIEYDRGLIDPERTYAIQARITAGEEVLFLSASSHPVITQGNPDSVEVLLESVRNRLSETALKKITFDISRLNEDGLHGPPDDLRPFNYGFCIPANEKFVEEVKAIDPTMVLYRDTDRRVGCNRNEFMVVGNTGQENYKGVLSRLAELVYVWQIHESFAE